MVFVTPLSTLVLLSTLSTLAQVSGATVQKPLLQLPADAAQNRQTVKDMFLNYAWSHDDVRPISQSSSDDRNGWGASIIDSLSAMASELLRLPPHIMGLDELFQEGVQFVSTVDFTKSRTGDTISVFETTIRYLGGLLSAYELSDRKYPVLLDKAKEVADTVNAIPYGHMTSDNVPIVQTSNIAEAGSYTFDPAYAKLGVGSARQIATQPHPLPGLAAQGIDPSTGTPVGDYVTWGGGSDSYFEYLVKYARLSNTNDPLWAREWATAVDSSIKVLSSRSGVGNWLYLADWYGGKTKRLISSHLACFHAGNFILGGKLLKNQTIVEFGLELNEGCWNTYGSSPTGIGPEIFGWKTADGNFSGPPLTAEKEAYYQKTGYYPPEILESNFYAWRATGDLKYQVRAAGAVANFQKYLRIPTGYAGIWDIAKPNAISYIDITESFWYAEVLSYLYLTFDDPYRISLDDYVFNTEAHPFKAPPAKPTYGDGTSEPTPTVPFPFQRDMPAVAQISQGPVLGDRLTKIITDVLSGVVSDLLKGLGL
ncbi:glycoside hydrolase family 47 protein [Thelephora ganbajun]|uniref:Glycoside hydrolase family 47 protein n=1 Tax=Thelephora ganbajun TaxID=370292 RepID=A0ACB6ZWP1_THEGA|nr:glycoside hydrolase family 47 protein [Thelephora ganbajun]